MKKFTSTFERAIITKFFDKKNVHTEVNILRKKKLVRKYKIDFYNIKY